MPTFQKETEKRPTTVTELYGTPKETWQYVTLPDEDPLGKKFATIRLNKEVFEAGQTYNVPPQIADYLKERIKVFNRSCVRLLQPDMAQDGIVRTAEGAASAMPTLA